MHAIPIKFNLCYTCFTVHIFGTFDDKIPKVETVQNIIKDTLYHSKDFIFEGSRILCTQFCYGFSKKLHTTST